MARATRKLSEIEIRWADLRLGRDANCQLCPLYRKAQSVCTQGDGNVMSPLMLVGEAPGQKEDELEKPFQGRAGKLLDQMLTAADLARGQVYVDNVVRCRPPDNRKPDDKEVATCQVHLVNVLRIIQPRVVVAMGDTALYGMTGRHGITKLRGQKIWSRMGIIVVPTFHPAYVLRNPSSEKVVVEDFVMAKRMVGLFDIWDPKI